jgi:hypothetical protein
VSLIDLARRYVELSNAARLDEALAMFRDDARYESSQVGAFEGRPAIEEMMRAFFDRYERPTWSVDSYTLVDDDTVEFAFTMTARAADGVAIERQGVERIAFDDEGRVFRVWVDVRAWDRPLGDLQLVSGGAPEKK